MKKELIAFAGGFVVGFGIGYGVSYILTKKKYEKIAEKEIEEAKEFYSGEWSNVIHKDPPATLLEKAQNGEIDADEIHIGIANNRGGLSEAKNTVDYTKYYAKKKEGEPYDPAEHEYPSEEDIEETMEDHFTEGKRMTEEAKEIGNYIIAVTPESYVYDFPQYDKQTLFYYVGDKTLVTEEEEMIDDVSSIVGNYIFDDSLDTVYIRNGKLGADYEIQKVDGFFR